MSLIYNGYRLPVAGFSRHGGEYGVYVEVDLGQAHLHEFGDTR